MQEPGCAEVNAHSISALILGLARAMAKGLYKHVLATTRTAVEMSWVQSQDQHRRPGRDAAMG